MRVKTVPLFGLIRPKDPKAVAKGSLRMAERMRQTAVPYTVVRCIEPVAALAALYKAAEKHCFGVRRVERDIEPSRRLRSARLVSMV